MVCDINDIVQLDKISLQMLLNNKIAGLAPVYFEQIDQNRFLQYDVSSRISANQYFVGTVSKKGLLGIFGGIVAAMLSAEDYMLVPESIILDLEYIFVDVSTYETILICLPFMGENTDKIDMREFFRNIVFNTKFDQSENCDYVAKIINYLNGASRFSLNEFKKVLEECRDNAVIAQQEMAATQIVKKKPVLTSDVTQQAQSVAILDAAVPLQPAVPKSAVSQSVVPQPVEGDMIQPVVNPGSGMPIPLKMQKSVSPTSGSESVAQDNQNEISLFYLLQHYNKDNAAAYKAQKAAKKEMKLADSKPATSKKQEASIKNESLSFAIPGQEMMPANSVLRPTVVQPVVTQQPIKSMQSQAVSKPANFGNTTVLNVPQSNATTVLDAAAMPGMAPVTKPYLIRKKNNETIPIDKNEYRLGKERSFVDYFIGDNTAISRSHACIVYHDNEYFIMDTNSTNHTFVNDIMIQSNVETKLESGTKIRLADEEFEFKMM